MRPAAPLSALPLLLFAAGAAAAHKKKRRAGVLAGRLPTLQLTQRGLALVRRSVATSPQFRAQQEKLLNRSAAARRAHRLQGEMPMMIYKEADCQGVGTSMATGDSGSADALGPLPAGWDWKTGCYSHTYWGGSDTPFRSVSACDSRACDHHCSESQQCTHWSYFHDKCDQDNACQLFEGEEDYANKQYDGADNMCSGYMEPSCETPDCEDSPGAPGCCPQYAENTYPDCPPALLHYGFSTMECQNDMLTVVSWEYTDADCQTCKTHYPPSRPNMNGVAIAMGSGNVPCLNFGTMGKNSFTSDEWAEASQMFDLPANTQAITLSMKMMTPPGMIQQLCNMLDQMMGALGDLGQSMGMTKPPTRSGDLKDPETHGWTKCSAAATTIEMGIDGGTTSGASSFTTSIAATACALGVSLYLF